MESKNDTALAPKTENSFLKSTVIITLITFIISITVLSILMGPRTCVDGWSSPSIGNSGACSHHGGVGSKPTFMFALLIAATVGGLFYKIRTKAEKEQMKGASEIDPTNSNDVYAQPMPTDDRGLYDLYKHQCNSCGIEPRNYDKWLEHRKKRR